MMVKLTALVGDNATSGLLLDANYLVHRGPDNQGRVLVFDEFTTSFRTLGPGEYREVPDPQGPHELVRIRQDPDGYRAVCSCIWDQDLAAGDPDEATHLFKLLHLAHMERSRYHLTRWGEPQILQILNHWRHQQWRRRQEPER